MGSFEVLSDHGDAEEDDDDVDEFLEEATRIIPPPPLASWFKNTETSKHNEMHCRNFRKPCDGNRRDEESPFFDCWDWKHEQSGVLQQVDLWARNAPKSVPSVISCLLPETVKGFSERTTQYVGHGGEKKDRGQGPQAPACCVRCD